MYSQKRPKYVQKRPIKETCKKTLLKRPQKGSLTDYPTETYVYTTETYVYTKETCVDTKETYSYTQETSESTKETYLYTQETYV